MTQLVTARGNLWFNPTANFYYITERSEPENIATNISQVFLGVRLECARCHNHPWERWSQDDFWGFAAFFGRMGVKDTYGGDQTQIILKDRGEVLHPRTKQAVTPKYLDGPGTTERPDEDIRDRLAAWITSPQNPWFARNIVNRLWKHYLGRGIVEPVDDMCITNPPTNESLLDALAQDFVQHGFRLKHTARTILNSPYLPAYRSTQPEQPGRRSEPLPFLPQETDGGAVDGRHLAGHRGGGKISRPQKGATRHATSFWSTHLFSSNLWPPDAPPKNQRAPNRTGYGAGLCT